MKYAQIRKIDIANGEGVRVSLFVQGCHRHCPNCFNQETWDFAGGQEFDQEIEAKLIELVNQPHVVGITILGGEPLEEENRSDVVKLLKRLKENCPGKTIWLYSAFLYEDILEFDVDVLSYLDVLVDGPFVDALKDRKLRFRGSSNQRIIDVQASLQANEIILHKNSRYYSKGSL